MQLGVGLVVGIVQGAAPGRRLYQPPLEGPPPLYEVGRGLGMAASGVVEFFGGGGIATGGVVVCTTGVGCLGGAPATALGVAVAANGATSVAAGNRVVQNALNSNNSFSKSSGSRGGRKAGNPSAKPGDTSAGPNKAKLPDDVRDQVWAENAASHGGTPTCEHCGKAPLIRMRGRLVGGQILPDNMGTIDHIKPRALGGTNNRSNLQLLCRICNQLKLDKFVTFLLEAHLREERRVS